MVPLGCVFWCLFGRIVPKNSEIATGDCLLRTKFGICIDNLGTVIVVVTRCLALINRWEGARVSINSSQVCWSSYVVCSCCLLNIQKLGNGRWKVEMRWMQRSIKTTLELRTMKYDRLSKPCDLSSLCRQDTNKHIRENITRTKVRQKRVNCVAECF